MQVYRQGRRQKGSGFTVISRANGLADRRLGISVHRMIRGAVRRNRIKRILREVFRLNRHLFQPSSDIVITVSPDFRYVSTRSVQAAVSDLLRKERSVTI